MVTFLSVSPSNTPWLGAALRPIPFEQFLEWLDEDIRAEWVNSQIVVHAPPSAAHQQVEALLLMIVGRFVRSRRLGLAVHSFLLKLASSCRRPDLLVTRTPLSLDATFVEGPVDLVVEIVSADSRTRDLEDKPVEYAGSGVGEYWIADLIAGEPRFFQRDAAGQLVEVDPDSNGIYTSRVLPGLRFPARWLVHPPDPDWAAEQLELAVTGERFEAEVARAEAAELRAEVAATRAESERVRAE